MIFEIRKIFILLFLALVVNLSGQLSADDYSYHVEFPGVQDKSLIQLIESVSQSVTLKDTVPENMATLRRRAEGDVAAIIKALQSIAYYHPTIQLKIDTSSVPIRIIFTIEAGAIYHFKTIKILPTKEDAPCNYPLTSITTEELGICPNAPAFPKTILEAEDTLFEVLEGKGYPLAKVTKRDVIADETDKTITLVFYVDSGLAAVFGETVISGNATVLPCFFSRKITWYPGQDYDPKMVERTLNNLEASGLFSSINITNAEEINADGSLPMYISVQEAKQRSVAFGVGYATDLGPGVNAQWEHRNVRGMGEKVSAVANLWWIKQQGLLRYVKPDFLRPRQELIWQADMEHEATRGYRELSASLSGTIERQINDRLRISYGGRYTWLRNTHSDNNRSFNLAKIPMQLMWNNADSLLDPTKGMTVHLKCTPALQTLAPTFAYCTNTLTATGYQPLDEKRRFVLAAKVTLGSIWGASKHSIPPSERFYAGSDILLRGYHFWTVSPLDQDNDPIGGRSMLISSIEARWRITNTFGLVAFYDIGNVYSGSLPQITSKQLQSAGLGIRYHTPVGPLRLDFAVPFNPRRHLDRSFQVYFGIGQTF